MFCYTDKKLLFSLLYCLAVDITIMLHDMMSPVRLLWHELHKEEKHVCLRYLSLTDWWFVFLSAGHSTTEKKGKQQQPTAHCSEDPVGMSMKIVPYLIKYNESIVAETWPSGFLIKKALFCIYTFLIVIYDFTWPILT